MLSLRHKHVKKKYYGNTCKLDDHLKESILYRYIKSEQNIMMLNMCGALTISLVMFITTVEKTHDGVICIS